jgi:hypothetical protein
MPYGLTPSRNRVKEPIEAHRTCAQCKQGFFITYYRTPPNTRFCSRKCRLAFHDNLTKRRRREAARFYEWQGLRVCDRCGKTYNPVRRLQRFCGTTCAQADRVLRLRQQRA